MAEWPSPLAAPPPETPKQRREGVREDGCEAAAPKGHVMTKFAAATVYLQVRRHGARCARLALAEPLWGLCVTTQRCVWAAVPQGGHTVHPGARLCRRC